MNTFFKKMICFFLGAPSVCCCAGFSRQEEGAALKPRSTGSGPTGPVVFLAALSVHCCAGFSRRGGGAALQPRSTGSGPTGPVVASALGSFGSRAKWLCYGVWNLPGSGIEPVSPALAADSHLLSFQDVQEMNTLTFRCNRNLNNRVGCGFSPIVVQLLSQG